MTAPADTEEEFCFVSDHSRSRQTEDEDREILTYAHIICDSAHEEVSNPSASEKRFHLGVTELLVVEESRVGVDVGVDALVHSERLWVDLRQVVRDRVWCQLVVRHFLQWTVRRCV